VVEEGDHSIQGQRVHGGGVVVNAPGQPPGHSAGVLEPVFVEDEHAALANRLPERSGVHVEPQAGRSVRPSQLRQARTNARARMTQIR
jgi:hypothetical protein